MSSFNVAIINAQRLNPDAHPDSANLRDLIKVHITVTWPKHVPKDPDASQGFTVETTTYFLAEGQHFVNDHTKTRYEEHDTFATQANALRCACRIASRLENEASALLKRYRAALNTPTS
jgi:hypothetical protein